MTLTVGDVATLTYALTVDGQPAAATVVLTVTAPDGTSTTPAPANPALGQYRADVVATQAGTWSYRWAATGTATDAESGSFVVAPPRVGTAFASVEDLATRLGRAAWTDPAERAQVQILLEDATAHLRAVIGWHVSPPTTVTTTLQCGGDVRLPGAPVTSIAAVTINGVTAPSRSYALEDGTLRWLHLGQGQATVQYTVGYPIPPADLVSWTCVLASQALSTLEQLGSLGGGGVSSVAIDDYRRAWADGGDGAGFVLPVRVEHRLREQYGAGSAFVTGSR